MAQLHVEAEATAKAAPETVWALVSDVTLSLIHISEPTRPY